MTDVNSDEWDGIFITLEGIDGSGKSSHIEWLVDALTGKQVSVVSTREPGGTPLGEKLRKMILMDEMNAQTETLLMFAARKEHLVKVIQPSLAKGLVVVSDRFTDSSFAYQSGGRGLDAEYLYTLESLVLNNFQPDITFLFDIPVEVAQKRIAGSRIMDRFELEQFEFHERVRQAYLDRAARFGDRIKVIDATRTIEDIRGIILSYLNN